MNNIFERICKLREEVRKHDILYDENRPIITDSEYDELYMELEKLEREHPEFYDANSPTQKIIVSTMDKLEKKAHSVPMLSQDKVTTVEGIKEFLKRVKKDKVLVQQKLDGLTVVIKYNKGRMFEAITRGNGEIGEVVTHTVKCFSNLPKVIPFKGYLEIRGEAIIPFANFEELNKDGKYSNTRNFVSGQIRRLDNKGIKNMGIKAIIFDLIQAEGEKFKDDMFQRDFLRRQGFEVVKTTIFYSDDFKNIMEFIQDYDEERKLLPHAIDGLVIKFNDLALREKMGTTSKYPKWAIAYKFKSLDAITKLIGVTWQVGKQGQITPVSELKTVTIDNVNISRATLHNYRNIKDKDIRINDSVIIKRANDVIPQIVGALKDLRHGNEIEIKEPKECPACGERVEFEGENLYCTNINCTPQIEGKLKHFASRNAMNIDGLGAKTVEIFYREGIINTIVDIYNLEEKKDRIVNLEGFGEKSYEKIIGGVEASKHRELKNFIYSLSIKNIGESASRDLAKEFLSMDEILSSFSNVHKFRERLLSIPDFGNIMVDSIINFLSHGKNIDTIKILKSYGVNMTEEKKEIIENSINENIFVVTGNVNHFANRKELIEKIEGLGGKVSGSVSKNTNYLINNDITSSSSKNKKAKELGVPIITEEDFLKMIE